MLVCLLSIKPSPARGYKRVLTRHHAGCHECRRLEMSATCEMCRVLTMHLGYKGAAHRRR